MGPLQTYKLLDSKGNYGEKKDSLWNNRKYLQRCDQQGPNFQNTQTAHKVKTKKQRTQKTGRRLK